MSSPMAGDEYVKIERLEAELAECAAGSLEAHQAVERWAERALNAEAELADWQRHGVKVTEDCEPCKGTGEFLTHGVPCLDCGGTGKKLRDGVNGRRYGLIEIPAEWLEATDE